MDNTDPMRAHSSSSSSGTATSSSSSPSSTLPSSSVAAVISTSVAASTSTSTMKTETETDPTLLLLASANAGFDHLFANDIARARAAFSPPPSSLSESPFHVLGLGVCAFLAAALGMESGLMPETMRLLAASEAGAKRAVADARRENSNSNNNNTGKNGKSRKGDGGGRFAPGLEYEILQADAVVLLGVTHALSESYMGYFQCMYALNAAHSKFTKLYKTVFPAGLDAYSASASSSVSANSASSLLSASASASASTSNSNSTSTSVYTPTTPNTPTTPSNFSSRSSPAPSTIGVPPPAPAKSIFGRLGLGGSKNASTASLASLKGNRELDKAQIEKVDAERKERERPAEGPVEEMVVAGTAFGFGLFNLVFALLPKKVQSLVGFLGFKHDRALALRALAVSAGVNMLGEGDAGAPTGKDVHGVFAGLVLMTYYGFVLLFAGYQADEARTLRVYKAIVDGIYARYPTGALWILNRAKILRMSNDPQGAIAVLQHALEAPQTFVQADALLVFELAWTLLAQRRHQEAADAFVKMTELNSWSHATYYFIAAGCYISLGNRAKAQELLDAVPELLQRKKVGGKDPPTEVLIKKKLVFYQEKQKRRGGDPARFVECISISPADELAIFWNTHARLQDAVAEAHIKELATLTPPVAIAVPSSFLPAIEEKHNMKPGQPAPDLDTPDERALRALLLGIMHRTLRLYASARALLEAARGAQLKVSTWIPGIALFELAVTDLKEADADAGAAFDKAGWARALAGAEAKLDVAQESLGKDGIDLSSRLDRRIALLRDEIAAKRGMVGV